MTININPGFPNLSIDVWNPDGANATEGFSEQYFAPGVSEEFAKELIAFNKEVGAQDDVLTDSVQRGLLGGLPERGRLLTNSEHLVIHFQKLIVNAVTGEPAALTPSGLVALPPVLRTIPLLPNASVVPDSERNAYVELEIFKIEPESEIISSFYMRRADGKPLDPWVPGQFLPIRVTIPSEPQPALRTYTLSTTPNPDYYRLSIRRGDENSLVSRFLHANGRPGLRIEAMTPRGKFMLTPQSERPAVFVSGGVGITPMIAMATLYDGLTGIGVRRERIHYESFGSGTALKPELHPEIPARISASDDGSVPIRFAKSGITAEWSRDKGSLLEFAEAVGLAPVFGCRSGICGTCATRITSGAVDYIEEPLAPRGEGQVLLCCSVPAAAALVPAWCSTYRGIDPSKRRRNGATASRSVYLPL